MSVEGTGLNEPFTKDCAPHRKMNTKSCLEHLVY